MARKQRAPGKTPVPIVDDGSRDEVDLFLVVHCEHEIIRALAALLIADLEHHPKVKDQG